MIEFDTRTCYPWAEIHGILKNMKTLKVKDGKKVLQGDCELHDDNGDVTIAFAEKKAKKTKKAA